MLTRRRVFVKGLKVMAAIGVYDHEHGREQPLIIDAVFELSLHDIRLLKDTLNYEKVGEIARAIIARGHIKLVETLAEDLAANLLDLPYVRSIELTISKPEALGDADAAGVCVIFEKA